LREGKKRKEKRLIEKKEYKKEEAIHELFVREKKDEVRTFLSLRMKGE